MHVSDLGIALIKKLEGYSSIPYKDQAGKWTIGYGHLIKPNESFVEISEEEAEKLLRKDLIYAEDDIRRLVWIPLSQHEFDALASFFYNLGGAQVKGTNTLKVMNAGNRAEVPEWIEKWVWVTDEDTGRRYESDGLKKRRAVEAQVWQGKYPENLQ